MTVHQSIALRTAGVLFGTWLLLALAIADFPPPPGFVIVLLVLLACALLVYLRVPVYLRWRAAGAKGRTLRVARDGLLGGGAIALLSLLSPGEPSIQPGLSDRLIGIGVLIGLGIGNALAAYAFGLWLDRPETHAAKEGLSRDADVCKKAGTAAGTRLAFDPGHEGRADAAMLMNVVHVEAVDLPRPSQLDESDDLPLILGAQDPIAPKAPLAEGVRVDPRRPRADLLRTVIAGVHPMHGVVVEARDLRYVGPSDATDAHQQVRCRAATMRAHSRCSRLNSSTAEPVFSTRTSIPALRRASSVSSGTCMRP